MSNYRIEAATKEEWAERALRAEAELASGSFYKESDIDKMQDRIEELEAKLAKREALWAKAVEILKAAKVAPIILAELEGENND